MVSFTGARVGVGVRLATDVGSSRTGFDGSGVSVAVGEGGTGVSVGVEIGCIGVGGTDVIVGATLPDGAAGACVGDSSDEDAAPPHAMKASAISDRNIAEILGDFSCFVSPFTI